MDVHAQIVVLKVIACYNPSPHSSFAEAFDLWGLGSQHQWFYLLGRHFLGSPFVKRHTQGRMWPLCVCVRLKMGVYPEQWPNWIKLDRFQMMVNWSTTGFAGSLHGNDHILRQKPWLKLGHSRCHRLNQCSTQGDSCGKPAEGPSVHTALSDEVRWSHYHWTCVFVGKKRVNHPWLGMVNIPPLKMMNLGMIYDCFANMNDFTMVHLWSHMLIM